MAKRTSSIVAPVVAQTAPVAAPNKSQMIRDYKAANPTAGPAEISKALSTDKMPISAALAQQVLNGRGSSNKIDVNTIKLAATFVKSTGGKIDDAVKAIQQVGKFIDECGSAEKALGALEAYKALQEAIG